jgi:MFS family permease
MVEAREQRDQESVRGRVGRYPAGFYLAVAANFFFFTGFQWTIVTLPGYVLELGGGATQIGLAYGLSTLSAVLVRPFVGRLVDRWGRKAALLVGAALFALVPALYPFTTSVVPFLVLRLVMGLGIAAFTTAYTALVADLAPPARRGEAIGLSGVTNNLGMLFAPTVGALVQAQQGYTVHFLAAAAIGACSFLAILPVKEPRREPGRQEAGPGFWSTVRNRTVWVAALGGTGLAVAYGAVLSFLPPFADERGLTVAGGYFTAFAVAMMGAQASAGWLSDRVGRRAVAAPGMLVVIVAMIGLASASSDVALLVAGAGLGLSWGLVRAALDTAVIDAAGPQARGTALGFVYTTFDLGIGAGSFGLGVVAQAQGYAAAFYVAAAWAVVALAGYLVWGRRERP